MAGAGSSSAPRSISVAASEPGGVEDILGAEVSREVAEFVAVLHDAERGERGVAPVQRDVFGGRVQDEEVEGERDGVSANRVGDASDQRDAASAFFDLDGVGMANVVVEVP